MRNKFLVIGCIIAAVAVAIGAFGAHALKETLTAAGRADTYETAVRYQFYHAFALIITGLSARGNGGKWFNVAGYSFLAGTFIFCGALYAICFTGQTAFGAVAPVGGLAFIAGWVFLVLGFSSKV